MRRYCILAPLAFAVFIALTVAAWIVSVGWDPLDNNLSDIGASADFVTRVLFNSGCILSGMMLIGYASCMYNDDSKDIYEKASLCFAFAGIALMVVGVADAYTQPYHDVACAVLMAGAGAGMFLVTASNASDKVLLWSSVALLIFTIVQWPFFRGAVSEMMPIIAASIWSAVCAWRRLKEVKE